MKARNAKPKGRRAEGAITNEATEKEGARNQGKKTKARCCHVCRETDGRISKNCTQSKDKAEYTGKEGSVRVLITKFVHILPMFAIPGVAIT